MSLLPAFLRRRVLLARARDLLAAGEPRAALALLCDPLLDGSKAGRALADEAHARLAEDAHGGAESAIRDLLARMRAERAQGAQSVDGAQRPSGGASLSGAESAERALRFRLAVDDAGEFLVAAGSELVLGHVSSPRADLRFLAQVEAEHALLSRASDFHHGATWRIVPIGAARVAVGGREVEGAGRVLCDGDQVELGPNLAFGFRHADNASASALLELEHGLECSGAPRILLFAAGSPGRVRIGSASARPLRVPALLHDVALELVANESAEPAQRLSLACDGGVERGTRPDGGSPTALSVLVPPRSGARFTFGARARDTPPFSIVLSPIAEARAGGA